jgi:hypothetical protein
MMLRNERTRIRMFRMERTKIRRLRIERTKDVEDENDQDKGC